MNEFAPIVTQLKKRLTLPLPGYTAQERMTGRVWPMPPAIPENAKLSAVLCLLFPENGELHVLLMKRMEDNTPHSGQVSFPGGRVEEQDADLTATALREANEEVGILPTEVAVLGALSSLYIPVSNFNVFPYVGYIDKKPDYTLSRSEVSYVLEVPVNTLFHPERKTITDVISPVMPQVIRQVNAYRLADNTIIWGATAMILSELEAVLADIGL